MIVYGGDFKGSSKKIIVSLVINPWEFWKMDCMYILLPELVNRYEVASESTISEFTKNILK